MPDRTCPICSEDMSAMHGGRKYCSPRCRDRSRMHPCSECGAAMWASRAKAEVPVCRPCRAASRKPVRVPVVEWSCEACGVLCRRKAARGQVPKWCEGCRRSHRRNRRECEWCKTLFVGRDEQVFCSRSCAARRYRNELVLYVGPVVSMCEVPESHPSRAQRFSSGRVFVSGTCAWCREHFVIIDQVQARYCSRRCARGASRLRKGKFTVPPNVRAAIYERDSWTCQICMEPADPMLDGSVSWGATLDHIECQSWALVPDHSPTNLRLAHRWCNSVRSDGTYYTEADLRGAA